MKKLLLKTKFVLTAVFIFTGLCTNAQVKTKIFKDQIPPQFRSIVTAISKEIVLNPPQEFNTLLNDSKNDLDDKFAISLPVNINFNELAEKFNEGNFQIYALRIIAKGTLNISVEFGEFQLSEHAILSNYTNNGSSILISPLTGTDIGEYLTLPSGFRSYPLNRFSQTGHPS